MDILEQRIEEREQISQISAWGWLVQRLTAALLFVFLGTHFWALHFAVIGERITFERVQERLGAPWFIALDLALLATAIYHALYGIRGIIIDFGIGPRARGVASWGLAAVGVVGFALGFRALLAFL